MPADNAPDTKRQAVALSYERGKDVAPRVVASGRGIVADRIVELAEDSGVPIREDAALARALGALELGDPIPQEAYVAVAEVLAWVFRLDRA